MILFVVFWTLLAIDPVSRSTWALEQVLLVPAFLALVWSCRHLRWSNAALTAMFGFLALHTLGAHHTYSLVPVADYAGSLFGTDVADRLGAGRNHFDRLVHFSYGALLAGPALEVLRRWWSVPMSRVLIMLGVMSTAMLYELIEWGAAVAFAGEAGQAFLGTQGDVWDAHWDMLLATVGAGLTLACGLCVPRLVALGRRLRPTVAQLARPRPPHPA